MFLTVFVGDACEAPALVSRVVVVANVFIRISLVVVEGVAGGSGARVDREIHSGPRGELGRLPACHFVRERNSVARIRTQIGMRLEVGKRRCDLGGTREET